MVFGPEGGHDGNTETRKKAQNEIPHVSFMFILFSWSRHCRLSIDDTLLGLPTLIPSLHLNYLGRAKKIYSAKGSLLACFSGSKCKQPKDHDFGIQALKAISLWNLRFPPIVPLFSRDASFQNSDLIMNGTHPFYQVLYQFENMRLTKILEMTV